MSENMLEPGRYPNIKNEEYHKLPAIGSTNLRAAIRSWKHFEKSMNGEQEHKNEFDIGTAIHLALLEPEECKRRVVEAPNCKRGTKEWNDFSASCPPDAILLKTNDASGVSFSDIKKIQESMAEREALRNEPFLSNGEAEVTFIWRDELTGLLCKCRPDWIRNDGMIIDVKSVPDGKAATPDSFGRELIDFRYHVQAAFYLEGVNTIEKEKYSEFTFIPVEKKEPFLINEFYLDANMLKIGHDIMRTQLNRIKEYYDSNPRPYMGYPVDFDESKNLYTNWYVTRYANKDIKEIDYGQYSNVAS